ncbi:MAG: energy transducer TonB [Chitinophagales bacterium]|nr:energy transducer TonB [Chitinophagales bacterium]
MQREKKDKNFIKKPIYDGGPKAMREFIKKNMRYPQEAFDAKIEGTVVIKYRVDHQGKVVDAKVIAGLGYGCDEEAVRLVSLLTFKVPKSRGVKVLFNKSLKIHFRMPKKPPTTISYTVTKEEKGKEDASSKESNSGSYHYTINI